ncbi:unnamed protein product [Cochlearia groenlandica]
MLKSEPSLSIYCDSEDGFKSKDPITVTVSESVESDFSFAKDNIGEEEEEDSKGKSFVRNQNKGFEEEEEIKNQDDEEQGGLESDRPTSPPMHLAAGLGINKFDLYGNEKITFDLPSFDDENCDGYYKTMLDEYPLHPLLLNNYAKFLEYKGDLNGAEEYYHKCIVVEPNDGLALANYGRLVMKLHQDEVNASSYFERAVQASPEDRFVGTLILVITIGYYVIIIDMNVSFVFFSNVLAAYASFLWEINDDDDDESFGDGNGQGTEDSEPEAAENRSTRLSETEDGETLCGYAKAFWSINGDHEKALFYYEKAVEASPNDSIILGEYARFLWEIEE